MPRIERRSWLYWIVLLLLVGESLFVIWFQAIPVLAKLIAEPMIWANTETAIKTRLIVSWTGFVAVIATIALLLFRLRAAFFAYLFVVALFLFKTAMALVAFDPGMEAREIASALGSMIGGGIQIGLITWGLWAICRPPTTQPEDVF